MQLVRIEADVVRRDYFFALQLDLEILVEVALCPWVLVKNSKKCFPIKLG